MNMTLVLKLSVQPASTIALVACAKAVLATICRINLLDSLSHVALLRVGIDSLTSLIPQMLIQNPRAACLLNLMAKAIDK